MNHLTRATETALAHSRWLALVLGAVAATGFAPLNLWPLTLAAFAALIALISRAPTKRRAFSIGWLFGVGHFIVGNTWIATAFTYQAAMPAWLGWLAVVLLALYLAVFPALATLAAWIIAKALPGTGSGTAGEARGEGAQTASAPLSAAPPLIWPLVLAFAAAWVVTEWLRSWVFSGFVWNPLGVALVAPGLAGAARLIGTYGLGGLAVLASGTALLAMQRHLRAALLLGAGVGCAVFAGSVLPLFNDGSSMTRGNRASAITVVQPNIPQETKANPAFDAVNYAKLARLSAPVRTQIREIGPRGASSPPGRIIANTAVPRLLLWPEAAIPDFLESGYPLRYYNAINLYASSPEQSRHRLASLLGPRDLLVTGTADLEVRDGGAIGARNSVTVLDPQARIRGSYDKAHLVPYGEYLPMRPLLSAIGLSRLVPGDLDFWPGPGARTIDLAKISNGRFPKMGVQICYEIIFSGRVVDRRNRPGFIFNPSNDAWFGASGPPQHLAQARLRAIEEGLPIVRSTPTGISAVIDADGRILNRVGMHRAGRIDANLPPPRAPTLFALVGNLASLIFAGLLLVAAAAIGRRKPLAVI